MAWHAIDIIQPSIDKTMGFFKGPNLFWRWVKLGFLLFLFSLLSGGGGNSSNFDSGIGDSAQVEEAFSQVSVWVSSLTPQDVNNIIIAATFLFFLMIVIGILLTILKNMCFFAILESASTNKVEIRKCLRKFYGKAVSLTFLEVVFDLAALPFVLILVLAGVSFMLFVLGISGAVLGPLAALASNTALMVILVKTIAPMALVVMVCRMGQKIVMMVLAMVGQQAFAIRLANCVTPQAVNMVPYN